MTMTVSRLHKQLSELIAAGHGRKPVCINKRTFNHQLERDGVVIMPVGPETGGTTKAPVESITIDRS